MQIVIQGDMYEWDEYIQRRVIDGIRKAVDGRCYVQPAVAHRALKAKWRMRLNWFLAGVLVGLMLVAEKL